MLKRETFYAPHPRRLPAELDGHNGKSNTSRDIGAFPRKKVRPYPGKLSLLQLIKSTPRIGPYSPSIQLLKAVFQSCQKPLLNLSFSLC